MKRALVIIDLQQDFCPGGALAVAEGDRIVPLINRLMPCFDLVVATRDWHPPDHISFARRHGRQPLAKVSTPHGEQILWPDHCVQDSPGADFHPGLNRDRLHHVTYKGLNPEVDSYSGFFDNARLQQTDLHAYLQQQQITDIYLTGLATDYCVRFTALDALDLGYSTYLVADACRGVEANPGDGQRALDEILAAGGRIIASGAILHSQEGTPA